MNLVVVVQVEYWNHLLLFPPWIPCHCVLSCWMYILWQSFGPFCSYGWQYITYEHCSHMLFGYGLHGFQFPLLSILWASFCRLLSGKRLYSFLTIKKYITIRCKNRFYNSTRVHDFFYEHFRLTFFMCFYFTRSKIISLSFSG